jgi:hypothetical protein
MSIKIRISRIIVVGTGQGLCKKGRRRRRRRKALF